VTYVNCKTFGFTHCVIDKLVNFDDDVFSAPPIQTMVWMDAVVVDSGQTPFSICFPHYFAGIQIYNTGTLRCVCSSPTDMQKALTRNLVSCLQVVKTNLFTGC